MVLLATAAVGLALAFAGAVPAQPGFRRERARVILNDAVNTGAPLYNRGDHRGCYQVYRGALQSVLPLLRHRPGLRADIAASLREAHRQRSANDQAWTLRRAIDRTLQGLE
jgi:hypothetical protein